MPASIDIFRINFHSLTKGLFCGICTVNGPVQSACTEAKTDTGQLFSELVDEQGHIAKMQDGIELLGFVQAKYVIENIALGFSIDAVLQIQSTIRSLLNETGIK